MTQTISWNDNIHIEVFSLKGAPITVNGYWTKRRPDVDSSHQYLPPLTPEAARTLASALIAAANEVDRGK